MGNAHNLLFNVWWPLTAGGGRALGILARAELLGVQWLYARVGGHGTLMAYGEVELTSTAVETCTNIPDPRLAFRSRYN